MSDLAEQAARRRACSVAVLCSEAMSVDRPIRLIVGAGEVLDGVPSRARSKAPDYHLRVTVAGQEVDVFEVKKAEWL